MLSTGELRRWVDHFGTSERQVRRDHLLSHVLFHLPELLPEAVFFGGTALCRTYLIGWRLSEDVDVLVDALGPSARVLEEGLPRRLRREHPGASVEWRPERGGRIGSLRVGDLEVRVQLVPRDASYERYPVAPTDVHLRYEDLAPAVRLVCPTAVGAAAMKLSAWAERALPRDLCDLFGLLQAGLLTDEALEIAADAGTRIQVHHFDGDRLPSERTWQAALGHQMRAVPDRERALRQLHRALVEGPART